MKLYMTEHDKCDLLIQVTAWETLTVNKGVHVTLCFYTSIRCVRSHGTLFCI
jgi:hypothetical protein